MSGSDFIDLPQLDLPYQSTDELLIARDGSTYRAPPDPSIAGLQGTNSISWALFQIRKPSGQNGGNFHPPETWIERPFNYADSNNNFGSVTPFPTAGNIELPAGQYAVIGWLTGMENAGMRARFRPLSGPGNVVHSASIYSKHYSWQIPLQGLLAVTQTTQFIAEMWCNRNRNKSWGFGYRTRIEPELYGSMLFIRKN